MPALAPSCPLIKGYGDELENDYQSGQIFGNHRRPKVFAQRSPVLSVGTAAWKPR